MTSSELLIDALTKFGDSEPNGILIIWTDEDGNVQMTANTTYAHAMGMAEYAKLATFRAMTTK